MALEGSLKDFGLADILQLICFQRKTGILVLEGRMDKVRMLFLEGNIVSAESKRRIEDNRIGKILLKKGIIKEEDLQAVLEEQRTTGNKLGNILINRDLVKKEIIKEILKNQITETVIQVFGWKEGTYEFTAQGVPPDKEFLISLDTQHLLMEGLRIVDEWSQIKGKLTLDTVFIIKNESTFNLTDDEKEIFSCVDGENDVSTIIDISGLDNFQVSKTLLSLMEKGAIEAADEVPLVVREDTVAPKKELPSFLGYLPVVVIIISILLSFAIVLSQDRSIIKEFRASGMIEDLRFLIETYKFEHSEYPENLGLISNKKDPWKRPFIYRIKDDSFYLISAGADGSEGTEDDMY
ncbi:MAG: hypothetical protein A2X59_01865 [Nitrospirae bacterium GWC2_42_7]|nr:MAG: hypothetical protein A2X59_01865 [Nitrospirae bacterium GWC2_42_7]